MVKYYNKHYMIINFLLALYVGFQIGSRIWPNVWYIICWLLKGAAQNNTWRKDKMTEINNDVREQVAGGVAVLVIGGPLVGSIVHYVVQK